MHKILLVKEKGGISNVIQGHYQQVVKDDKTTMHASVDELAPTLGIKINQWYSIFITIYAQNQITKESWIDSFNKVNLHSQARVSFNDLIIKLDV